MQNSPHDVLDVGRITEFQSGGIVSSTNVRPASLSLKQKGVAVVPEKHATIGQGVDGLNLTSQTVLNAVVEKLRVAGQQLKV